MAPRHAARPPPLPVLLTLAACAAAAPPDRGRDPAPAPAATPEPARAAPAPPASADPVDDPLPTPAAPVPAAPARTVSVAVPGDRAVLVVAAADPASTRAIVYLPGKCGDIRAFEPWADQAARHGTLVAFTGDVRCDNGRYRWSHEVATIQRRIDAALAAVSASRGAPLDATALTAIGYSEGATRVEALARRYPDRYARLVLVAGPTPPSDDALSRAGAAVIIAGARDRRSHLQDAAAALAARGRPVAFLLLPGAGHGEYGPEGARVMGEALAWSPR